ncbi:unnamed protein product [Camellia sinensis]
MMMANICHDSSPETEDRMYLGIPFPISDLLCFSINTLWFNKINGSYRVGHDKYHISPHGGDALLGLYQKNAPSFVASVLSIHRMRKLYDVSEEEDFEAHGKGIYHHASGL